MTVRGGFPSLAESFPAQPLQLMNQDPILTFDAVLLAGGRSRRMGSDKALLTTPSGELLWQRQWRLLGEAGAGRRWLSVRADQTWVPPAVPTVRDLQPDAGPLAGVIAAWEESAATHLLVLAVDLPVLPVTWLIRLKQRARPGCGVAGRHPEGHFEPLAAVYPRSWLPLWVEALNQGATGLQRLLHAALESDRLQVEPIGPADAPWFHNLNTPGDLRLTMGVEDPGGPA